MNYPDKPMTLMVRLKSPAPIREFVEDMNMVKSRMTAELGNRVSNFQVLNDPEVPGIYVTFELAPLFHTNPKEDTSDG